MIRVSIELWPFGRHEEAKSLGVIDIWNDGTGTPTKGDYKYRIWQAGTPKDILHSQENLNKAKWAGMILGFPRKKLLVFDLLFRVLRATFEDRNIELMRRSYDFSNGVRGKYVGRIRKSTSPHRRKHPRQSSHS